jgi:peptidoglycan biosynthesis protein MviN/MurJ (putative lipid II flippase)
MELLPVLIAGAIFAVPCALLALIVRHFVPLVRGLRAPLWAHALGPLLFASDRFFTEDAKPHRTKFVAYSLSFISCCLVLVLVFGRPV